MKILVDSEFLEQIRDLLYQLAHEKGRLSEEAECIGSHFPELLAQPAQQQEPLKEGYRLVAVNAAFSDLTYYLDRASNKGYLDRLYDLVEPWEAFDYEYVDSHPAPADARLVEALEESIIAMRSVISQEAKLKAVAKRVLGDATDKARAALAAAKWGMTK
jgi:hypothetical protein